MIGRCVDCGYLAFRAQNYTGLRFRGHAGYHEVERHRREAPLAAETFIPGEANAVQSGEFACFRAAANLPQEIAIRASSHGLDPHDAAREVLYRARGCASWTQYVPGLDPQLHY